MATVDAVLIRKSSSGQDEKPQIGSVRRLLEAIDVTVPEQYWFVCTVSRDDVQSDKGFKRLKDLISTGRIGRIYIESQDRFGTDGPGELFVLLEFLRDNDTELYDLQNKCDLTEKDDLTEMRAFMGSMKSKKEVHDTSRRSTRSRAINFRDSGTWPTGIQPFGYAKRCFSEDGNTLLWEWQPETRILGQIFFAQGNKLTPGPKGVKIPRKEKKQKTYLTPSKNKEHVRTVQLVFSLFTPVSYTHLRAHET